MTTHCYEQQKHVLVRLMFAASALAHGEGCSAGSTNCRGGGGRGPAEGGARMQIECQFRADAIQLVKHGRQSKQGS
eukprot:1148577-Pelagomonas_calceolata.AAC.7